MTEVDDYTSRIGSQVGGHQTTLKRDYLDRSRSRETLVRRGEEYGRSGRGGQERDPRIRGREDTSPGPEKEMHGGKH
jgi:hypothetical protein